MEKDWGLVCNIKFMIGYLVRIVHDNQSYENQSETGNVSMQDKDPQVSRAGIH
jgi:hypothetical protein